MRSFSRESSVENPELIRGTQLRKHIATQSALLNIDESVRSDLASFLDMPIEFIRNTISPRNKHSFTIARNWNSQNPCKDL